MNQDPELSEKLRSDLKRFRRILLLILAVLGGILTMAHGHPGDSTKWAVTSKASEGPTQPSSDLTQGMLQQQEFSEILSKAGPAVVSISPSNTERLVEGEEQRALFLYLTGSRRLDQLSGEDRLGSGVIVSADGYILTSCHVLGDAEEVRVALSDNREFDARIIGQDPRIDIAVLKIDAGDLPHFVLANSPAAAPTNEAALPPTLEGLREILESGPLEAEEGSWSPEYSGIEKAGE